MYPVNYQITLTNKFKITITRMKHDKKQVLNTFLYLKFEK